MPGKKTWFLLMVEQLWVLLLETYSKRVLDYDFDPNRVAPVDINDQTSNVFGHGEAGQLLRQAANEAQ